MLCVSQVSGGSVLELGPDEFDALTSSGGSAVRALKERVRWATGIGIFRQSLVRHGCVLEENDKLDFPMDLQLVVTPCLTKMSAQDFEEMHRAVCVGDVHRLEAVLQKGHDPDAKDTAARYEFGMAWFVISLVAFLENPGPNLSINNIGSDLKSTSRSTGRPCTKLHSARRPCTAELPKRDALFC